MEKTKAAEYYEVSLCVRGIKKRCRKSEFRLFRLAKVTLDTRESETGKAKMIEAAKLRLEKEMKEVSEAWLSFTYGYNEEGSPFNMSEPFNERNFKLLVQ